MKIEKIERENTRYRVYFKPNWLEKLFGIRPKSFLFKEKGAYRPFGGTNIYIREDGQETSSFGDIESAIDQFRNKNSF